MTTTHPPPAAAERPPAVRARQVFITAPALLGALTTVALLFIRPWGERNQLSYEAIAPIRDAAWTGILIDSLATIAVGIGLSLVVCHLAPAKGATWAHIGAVLATAGSVVFGLGAFSFAGVLWHITDTDSVSPTAGETIVEHILAHPQHTILIQTAGFLAFTAGILLLCVALLRARTIARWLPLAVLVLTIAIFAAPAGVVDYVQAAQTLGLAAIGTSYLWSVTRIRE